MSARSPRAAGSRRPRRLPRWSALAGRTAAGALVAAGTLLALNLTGCGIPGERSAHVIASDDLPFGLAEGNGATTTPTRNVAEAAGSETVSLYFPTGSSFVEVVRELPVPMLLADIVEALATEPTGSDIAYRSAVGPDDVLGVSVRAGVAIVELDESFLDLPNSEQRVAVAQLVLSLTARPGIGQIDFVIGGEPVQVPRADGTLGKESVSRDDFIELVEA